MAAADVLFDPALPVGEHLLGFFLPVPVGGSPGLDSTSAAVEQPVDPVGQLVAVLGLGGDVVGGAGLFVVVATMLRTSWAASRLLPRRMM